MLRRRLLKVAGVVNPITFTGFTRRAFGTLQINLDILPTGFTQRAFGTLGVGLYVNPTGFTRRAFGTSTIDLIVAPTGFSRRAFGTLNLDSVTGFSGFTQRAFGTIEQIYFQVYPNGLSRRAFGRTQVGNDLHVDGFSRRAFGTATVRFLVAFTGFTRRAFGTARFSPNSQIGFERYGLSRRAFGLPHIDGGAQKLSVYIRGDDRRAYLELSTASITKQIQTTGTCEFLLVIARTETFAPELGDSLIIQEYGWRRFAGFVDEIDDSLFPFTDTFEYRVRGVDYNALADRRVVTGAFGPGNLKAILDSMNLTALGGEGIDTSGVDPTIEIADQYNWNTIKVREAFAQLALSSNTIWWIDDFKVLHFIQVADCLPNRYAISDGGMQVENMRRSRSLKTYRNRQYERASENLLSESFTKTNSHTFSGVNADIVCITDYPLTGPPSAVRENHVDITTTDRVFEMKFDGTPTHFPAGGEGWYWMMNSYGLWHYPSYIYPTAGTLLEVDYTGLQTYNSNVVIYADLAEIAAMAARTGGSGLFEEASDYSGAATYSELYALARGTVQSVAPVPIEFSGSTIERLDNGVGTTVGVSLTKYSLATSLVLHRYSQRSEGVDLGKGTSFRTAFTLVGAKTLGNWVSWFERVLSRSNQLIPKPTEKPTWALAFDTPAAISPALSTGTFGAPYAIQTGTGRIAYVAAVFGDPPVGSVIEIDILLNGTSIFNGAKLQYRTTDTGMKLYSNFTASAVNVRRGDLLTLVVIATGSDYPGKNGTVTAVVVER